MTCSHGEAPATCLRCAVLTLTARLDAARALLVSWTRKEAYDLDNAERNRRIGAAEEARACSAAALARGTDIAELAAALDGKEGT